jgi:hypothetical protein
MAATVAATTTATVAAITAAKTAAKSYAHVAVTIPLMPQGTYKPTEVYEITIRIGDAADREEASKQNSQALVHKLQAAGPLDTYRIQAVRKLQSGDIRVYIIDKDIRDRLL